jgi:hypothetical protein
MTKRIDIILTIWVAFLGIVYFGGSYTPGLFSFTYAPEIAVWSWPLSIFYVLMLCGSLLYWYMNTRHWRESPG